MCDKDLVLGKVVNLRGNIGDQRRISHHLIVNTRESCNKIGDLTIRIYQTVVLIDHLFPIMFKNGDLRDLVTNDPVPGSFYVDDAVQIIVLRD